jgi:hypothetical protein
MDEQALSNTALEGMPYLSEVRSEMYMTCMSIYWLFPRIEYHVLMWCFLQAYRVKGKC